MCLAVLRLKEMQTETWKWQFEGANVRSSAREQAWASAAALLSAEWLEAWESPETWREFSKSETARELRKANVWGGAFNEWGEKLQAEGLRTAFIARAEGAANTQDAVKLLQVHRPRPQRAQVLGTEVYDYYDTFFTPLPRALGVSLSLVWRDGVLPELQWMAHFEAVPRRLSTPEALAISGVSAQQLQEAAFLSTWVMGWLRESARVAGLEVERVELEWALSPSGDLFLSRPVSFDRLRITPELDVNHEKLGHDQLSPVAQEPATH